MDSFVELRQILLILVRRWWVLVLGAVLGAGLGYGVSRLQTPVYETTTTINIGRALTSPNIARQDLQVGEQLVLTYADLARRQPVLRAVIEKLQLSTSWQSLKSRVRARPVENTHLLEILVQASSAKAAQEIANTLAEQLILVGNSAQNQQGDGGQFAQQRLERLQQKIKAGQQRVETLETLLGNTLGNSIEKVSAIQAEVKTLEALLTDWDSTYSRLLAAVNTEKSTNNLVVVEPAELSRNPVQPRVTLNILLAALVGLALAAFFAFLQEYWDTTIRTAEDVTQTLGLATLGAITRNKRQSQQKLVFNRQDTAAVAEEYRLLRSKLQFISADWPRKVLLVTSLTPNEQNSNLVANLGAVMALTGYRTVVIDANLRQPRQHEVFQLPNRRGLSELLLAPTREFDGYLQNTSVKNLQLLTAGGTPTYPSELLSSGNMKALLAGLTANVDMVICDCADTTTFADAAALANYMDGVLLTIETGKVQGSMAQQVIYNLQQSGGNLVGVILSSTSNRLRALVQPSKPADTTIKNQSGGFVTDVPFAAGKTLPTNAGD